MKLFMRLLSRGSVPVYSIELLDTQKNQDKTFVLANSVGLEKDALSQIHESGTLLHAASSFKLVGSIITSRGRPQVTSKAERVRTTVHKLRKIAHLPLKFNRKVKMARAIFPTAVLALSFKVCQAMNKHNCVVLSIISYGKVIPGIDALPLHSPTSFLGFTF